jgi:hypothetical protein
MTKERLFTPQNFKLAFKYLKGWFVEGPLDVKRGASQKMLLVFSVVSNSM